MATCGYCGSTILMGGVKAANQRFCNNKCAQGAYVLSVTQGVPAATLEQKVNEVWQGQCPICQGSGPIEVHKSYQVWSALILTNWSTKAQVSCRSCARSKQVGGAAFSLVAGWWGFPWGLILTPVQITRNFIAMSQGPKDKPSEALRKAVLVNIGTQILARQQATPPVTQSVH